MPIPFTSPLNDWVSQPKTGWRRNQPTNQPIVGNQPKDGFKVEQICWVLLFFPKFVVLNLNRSLKIALIELSDPASPARPICSTDSDPSARPCHKRGAWSPPIGGSAWTPSRGLSHWGRRSESFGRSAGRPSSPRPNLRRNPTKNSKNSYKRQTKNTKDHKKHTKKKKKNIYRHSSGALCSWSLKPLCTCSQLLPDPWDVRQVHLAHDFKHAICLQKMINMVPKWSKFQVYIRSNHPNKKLEPAESS